MTSKTATPVAAFISPANGHVACFRIDRTLKIDRAKTCLFAAFIEQRQRQRHAHKRQRGIGGRGHALFPGHDPLP